MSKTTRKILILRILTSIILLFSVLFMPFWVSAVLALVGMIYFKYYIEALFLFLLSDLLYGAPEAKFYNMVFVSFILALIIFLIIEYTRKKIRY